MERFRTGKKDVLRSHRSSLVKAGQIASLALLSALLTAMIYLATQHGQPSGDYQLPVTGAGTFEAFPGAHRHDDASIGPAVLPLAEPGETGQATSLTRGLEGPAPKGRGAMNSARQATEPDAGEPEHTSAVPTGSTSADPAPAPAVEAVGPENPPPGNPPAEGLLPQNPPQGGQRRTPPAPGLVPHGAVLTKPAPRSVLRGAPPHAKPAAQELAPVASGPPTIELKTCWTLWRSGCAAGGSCPLNPGYAPCGTP